MRNAQNFQRWFFIVGSFLLMLVAIATLSALFGVTQNPFYLLPIVPISAIGTRYLVVAVQKRIRTK